MPFQYRDLLISRIPESLRDGIVFAECDGGSTSPPGGTGGGGPEAAMFELDAVELRSILQLALAHLGGPVNASELAPRSLDELNELETSLSSALDEVRAMKSRFGV